MNKIVTSYLQKTGFRNIDLKAVLIDMDGVLYDSMPFHADAWYKAISSLGIACTPEEFFMYEGRTGASTIDLIFNRAYGRNADENEKQMIYARKCEYFVAKGVAPVMPGALDFLRQVKSHRLIPVLVTGSGQHSLLDKLSHDYPGIFTPQTMVTAFDVKYGKPDPEPYLIGLEKAGVAARIFTVAVNTGPLPDRVLLDAGADYLLPDMERLAHRFEDLYIQLNM